MNITVYLASSTGNDPKFEAAVKELGTWIGASSNTLIYGGSKTGLMGELAQSVLQAGGKVIGVEPQFFIDEDYQYEGLTQLMMTIRKVKELYNPQLAVLGILITMYNGRFNLSQAVIAEIKKYYSDKLMKTTIPRSVKLSEAPGFGMPIGYHDRYSKAAEAYRDAARELLERIGIVV